MSRTMRVGLGGGSSALVVVLVAAFVASGSVLDPGRLEQAVPLVPSPGTVAPSERRAPVPPAGGVDLDLGSPRATRARPTAPPETLADLPFTPGAPIVRLTDPLTPAALTPATPPPDLAALPSLSPGDEGEAVARLQARLAGMGFRATETDGYFGAGTASAVLAFQKFEGLERTGSVGVDVWSRLYQPQGWLPPQQRTTAPKIEVDLERQVLFLLNADRPGQVAIMNTSTGGGYYYTNQDGSTAFAFTPDGNYEVYRRYDGLEVAPLGTLYRPLYFVGGWAVHGSPSVPEYPASHGCVRLSNDDMDWVWDRAPDNLAVTVRETMNPAALHQQSWEEWVSVMAEAPTMSAL